MKEILYFDAAASALKPERVIAAQADFLQNHYANAGRGVCARASAVDDMVAQTRVRVARFIGANADQVVFTSGATDGLNRIANMLAPGSVVAVSDLDHHSARMPFERKYETVLCQLHDDLNIADVPKCDAVVITAMSNVLGAAQDVKKLIANARAKNPNVVTIVDAAQYAAHLPIDTADWDCDFLCWSGHKIGADTGVGVMFVKEPDKWQSPIVGGGTAGAIGPAKFEAGTLPLTQICGLSAQVTETGDRRQETGDRRQEIGDRRQETGDRRQEIGDRRQETGDINKYIYDELAKTQRIKLLTGPRAAMVSFVVDGMHALDFGALAGANGICLRAGNMCASWIHKYLGLDGSVRISAGPWNTMAQAEQVVRIIRKILK